MTENNQQYVALKKKMIKQNNLKIIVRHEVNQIIEIGA